ncbi:MAG: FAD-dependent oxidoreductase [Desulfococcaceae bacterium]|jgi:NADPH-dependent 2,4-dienoyl-CoA reductase/sulfur reductase-like enzyme/peroxiredoxin family protein/TusA-related sulfurtransferase/rhodanese-related sulfurtransferase|nr:FAD-dependent oxidoreductase [Desulfococcaceae bacterium]
MEKTEKEGSEIRLLIVGGVAGGASAAARARRLSEKAHITIIERGYDVSFANCGLPYHIGGEITDRDRLNVQTAQTLEALINTGVKTRTEALSIDREKKTLRVKNLESGQESELSYDKLILAPGAAPLRPPLPGIENSRIMTLRNLQDMDSIIEAAQKAKEVLIIGAGFIGLEMAEQLHHIGKKISLVELQEQVLPQMDPEMSKYTESELRDKGVNLVLGDGISSFEGKSDRITAVLNSGRKLDAELVILSIGVKAESKLAQEAGLETGMRGTIAVNEFQQTSDPDIYAVGDAAETAEPILGQRTSVPLGGPANRQGRVAADHIFMPEKARPYPGTLGTAIVRVFDAVAAMTGWTEKRLKDAKEDFRAVVVTDNHHAGYYPGATHLTVKIIWSPSDGRLLGAQVTGVEGVDKRIDVLATMIKGRQTIDDLCHLELAYAPPFGSAKDVLNIAGFAAANLRDGLTDVTWELPRGEDIQILDTRPKDMTDIHPLKGAVNIPLPELRKNMDRLDKNKTVVTVCALGKTSYFASRILRQNGFKAKGLMGGLRVFEGFPQLFPEEAADAAEKTVPAALPDPADIYDLDATGLACPGPLLKVKEAVKDLKPGQVMEVTASDMGFARDLPVFCKSAGMEFLGAEKKKGLMIGRLRRPTEETLPDADAVSSAPRKGAALVLFSGELDKALASLIIANGAAALGGEVTVFFTFWGLNLLRKDQAVDIPEKTLMDKMFGKMMPRGIHKLPLSKMHFGGLGTAMMKDRMKSKNLPDLPGLLAEARKAGVKLVACSMSMEAMGIRQEELIDGIELGGVADFLGASQESATNLFI